MNLLKFWVAKKRFFGGTFSKSVKGQESAIFELLVAVIIMAFVIYLGTFAMSGLSKTTCYKEIEEKVDSFSSAIETVAKSGGIGQKRVPFNLPVCYIKNTETRIGIQKEEKSVSRCRQYCPGIRDSCYFFVFHDSENTIIRCLDVSISTQFPETESDNGCPKTEDIFNDASYSYVDLRIKTNKGTIPLGIYELRSVESISSSQPIVCAYRQVK